MIFLVTQEVVRIEMGMGAFGWGELISLLAVTISFVTICVNIFGNSKKDTQNEQWMHDKIDHLTEMSKDINNTVKSLDIKLSDHSERLARLESDNETIFRRLKRIETTQDHCQACRVAKQQMIHGE